MSYSGNGTFLINSAGQPVVPGTTITTTAFNALTADLATGLTTAMTKDGQTVPTANIPMGGFKLTGLGAGTSATDAAQFGQLQNAPVATLITVAGADTITGTLVQTLTAYATGQQFSFVAAGTNTTAVTLNIDGLGAKAVTRTGAVALAAGALVSGQMAIVEYDGTRFQLINANAFTNLTVSGALTVGTTLAVTGVATLTAQPILSSLTASLPVFSDGSKGLVSNAMTGTGSVVMSASPTLTGTIGAASQTLSGSLTVGTTLGVTGAATLLSTLALGTSGMTVTGSATAWGFGVAPSVWTNNYLALEVRNKGNGISVSSQTDTTVSTNWYYSSGQKFAGTGYASNYVQDSGTHYWSTSSASGTAGNTATMTTLMSISAAGAVTIPGTLGVTGVSTLTGGATIGTGSNVLGLKIAYLTADNQLNSSTTLTTLSDLTVAIGAGETWLIEWKLRVGANLEATGLGLAVDTPASATQDVFYQYIPSALDLISGVYTGPAMVQSTTTDAARVDWTAAEILYGGRAIVTVSARVTASGAGNVLIQFAQETSTGTSLIVYRGSSMKAQRVT